MTRQRKLFWAKTGVILAAIPVLIYAHEFGPDAGVSGVPGEFTCIQAACHVGTLNPNTGGKVEVAFPGGANYTPGVKQHLVVTVSDPNQRRWGFQLTARASGDPKTQAGSFKSTDANTTLMCASTNLASQTESPSGASQGCSSSQPLQYIEHSLAGAKTQSGSGSFEFDWTPPATDIGSVVIYVAGNAANGDRQPTGDRIYTRTYTLTPSAGGGGAKPVISQNQVVNGASEATNITGGAFVQIKGTNLSNIADPNGRTWKNSEIVGGKLPASLDGTSVTINGKPAYVYYISPTQVNVISASDTNQGPVNVVVTNNGQASDPASVTMQPFSPAIFPFRNGTTWVIATRNPDGALIGDSSKVAGTVSAKPGDVIIFWGTGFGPTNPATADGELPAAGRPVATLPTVQIGGVTAPVVGAAISGFAGLYQVAVTVPNVGDGEQEVIVTAGGLSSPKGFTIYVKR